MMIRILFATTAAIAAIYPTVIVAQACTVSDSADYRVEFSATWSEQTLPQQFPANAHFSGLVGGSHNAQVTFWEEGGIASDGIEAMAERGAKGTLIEEVNAAISDGSALDPVSGGGIGLSPGFVSTTFTVDQAHPLATIVSMIAPSPDWFVGVHGLNLLRYGNWLADATVELFGYDAGTDNGVTYNSANSDTQPRQPITLLSDPTLFEHDGALVSFGTFRFIRLTESCADTDNDGIENDLDNCILKSNGPLKPDAGGHYQRDTDLDGYGNACDADLNNDGVVNFADLALFKLVFGTNDHHADFDGNEVVNFADLAIFRASFGKPPGPSSVDP